MAAGCGGTCEPAPQTRGFPRGMAAGCGGTCGPAPQTRGLPRGMAAGWWGLGRGGGRSEEHTAELQSLMRISYAVFCLRHKPNTSTQTEIDSHTDRITQNL